MWLSSLPFIAWFWYWKNEGIIKDCGAQICVIHCRYLLTPLGNSIKSILDLFLIFLIKYIFWFSVEKIGIHSWRQGHRVFLFANLWTRIVLYWGYQRKNFWDPEGERVIEQNNTESEPFASKLNAVFSYCIDDAFRMSGSFSLKGVTLGPHRQSWSMKPATCKPPVWDFHRRSPNCIIPSPS